MQVVRIIECVEPGRNQKYTKDKEKNKNKERKSQNLRGQQMSTRW